MPTALIVGASRGIGLEFTRQYLAAGWRVFATFRSEADRIRLRDMGAQTLKLDVLDARRPRRHELAARRRDASTSW